METPPTEYENPTRRATAYYRAIAVIWLIVTVIDVLIAARFLLLLFGASTASGFVAFVYNITEPLVAPFQGIFGTPATATHVFEAASLVAIVVYLLLGALVVAIIRIASGRRRPDAGA